MLNAMIASTLLSLSQPAPATNTPQAHCETAPPSCETDPGCGACYNKACADYRNCVDAGGEHCRDHYQSQLLACLLLHEGAFLVTDSSLARIVLDDLTASRG